MRSACRVVAWGFVIGAAPGLVLLGRGRKRRVRLRHGRHRHQQWEWLQIRPSDSLTRCDFHCFDRRAARRFGGKLLSAEEGPTSRRARRLLAGRLGLCNWNSSGARPHNLRDGPIQLRGRIPGWPIRRNRMPLRPADPLALCGLRYFNRRAVGSFGGKLACVQANPESLDDSGLRGSAAGRYRPTPCSTCGGG